MRLHAYSKWIFRERSGEARKNTTEKVPHYAQKQPRHMANNFHRLCLRKRHIYYVRCLVCERQAILLQHLESTQLYKNMVAAYNTLQNTNCIPLACHITPFLRDAESWLDTPNSAAHAHLAIGAYLAYRRISGL